MARISKIELNQLNKQFDRLENVISRLGRIQSHLEGIRFQVAQLDYLHAKQTTNNLTFTWTGATTTIS